MGPGDELPVSLGFIILKARAAGLEKEAWNMGRRGWRMSGGGGRGCSGEIQYYKGGGSHTLGDLIDNYIILPGAPPASPFWSIKTTETTIPCLNQTGESFSVIVENLLDRERCALWVCAHHTGRGRLMQEFLDRPELAWTDTQNARSTITS